MDNVGAGGMTAFDLERIKIPSGGMLAWEIPTITGKPEYVQEFDGVVIFHKDGRVYWEKPLAESGGNEPPDCSSADCVVGIGNPGGSCGQCPFARFGSDQQGGRGQACKQVKQLFVARSDGLLPVVLPLPPTSLSVARKYFLRLTSRRIPYYGVLTRFSLEKATNKGGIAYARAVLSLVEVLPDAQREALRQVGEPCSRWRASPRHRRRLQRRPTTKPKRRKGVQRARGRHGGGPGGMSPQDMIWTSGMRELILPQTSSDSWRVRVTDTGCGPASATTARATGNSSGRPRTVGTAGSGCWSGLSAGHDHPYRCTNTGCVNPAHLEQAARSRNTIENNHRRSSSRIVNAEDLPVWWKYF